MNALVEPWGVPNPDGLAGFAGKGRNFQPNSESLFPRGGNWFAG